MLGQNILKVMFMQRSYNFININIILLTHMTCMKALMHVFLKLYINVRIKHS